MFAMEVTPSISQSAPVPRVNDSAYQNHSVPSHKKHLHLSLCNLFRLLAPRPSSTMPTYLYSALTLKVSIDRIHDHDRLFDVAENKVHVAIIRLSQRLAPHLPMRKDNTRVEYLLVRDPPVALRIHAR